MLLFIYFLKTYLKSSFNSFTLLVSSLCATTNYFPTPPKKKMFDYMKCIKIRSSLTSNSFPNNEHDALNAAGKKQEREKAPSHSKLHQISAQQVCLRRCFIEFYSIKIKKAMR